MSTPPEDFQKSVDEYNDLLERLGIKDEEPGQFKNRAHRRFNFNLPETAFKLHIEDDSCLLFDVSVGGLSFFSGNEYQTGGRHELNFDGRYFVNIEIANSFLDKAASSDGELLFRHGVRFLREGDGYRCVVAVLRYYLESLTADL